MFKTSACIWIPHLPSLLKYRSLGLTQGLGCGLRICILNTFPGDVVAAGLGATLWESLVMANYNMVGLLWAPCVTKQRRAEIGWIWSHPSPGVFLLLSIYTTGSNHLPISVLPPVQTWASRSHQAQLIEQGSWGPDRLCHWAQPAIPFHWVCL